MVGTRCEGIKSKSQQHVSKRNMRVREMCQIKLLQIFQFITRVDRYICLQLIFKNFRKLQISMDVVEVENINRQNLGTSKQTHYGEKPSTWITGLWIMGKSNSNVHALRILCSKPFSTKYFDC